MSMYFVGKILFLFGLYNEIELLKRKIVGRGHDPTGQCRPLSGKFSAQTSVLPGGGMPPPDR